MTNEPCLEFERPIADLERKIREMREFSSNGQVTLESEIKSLEKKLGKLRVQVYSDLSRWQRVQLSRHPKRPYTLDYIKLMTTDFVELHGDRGYSDDKAMIAGFAKIEDRSVMIVGQQKGRDTKQKLERNFGMAHPEGYRKARRMFKLAEKFSIPIVALIDTPGAYPGIGAEERGQAEAIARNILEMFTIRVPIVCVVIGEGASGGALGIGIGDRVMMMEYAWYSVISPEGCAAILWRDASKAPDAAEALKVTSDDNMELGIVDRIIPEPERGAHNDPSMAAQNVKQEILNALEELSALSIDELLEARLQKYRKIGKVKEV